MQIPNFQAKINHSINRQTVDDVIHAAGLAADAGPAHQAAAGEPRPD